MTTSPVQLPPAVRLLQMATGFFLSRIVVVAAKLSIADHLASGPKSADELARATGCRVAPLYRFLRTLTNYEMLTLDADGRFALTSLGDALRGDAPGHTRSTILILGSDAIWNAWGELPYVLETGDPGFDKVNGQSMFDYLGDNPDDARRFSEAMLTVHAAEPDAVADAYDFSSAGDIVDIGGASGGMLASVLSRHPSARGVLFDLPQATTEASALLQKREVASRVRFEHGSFFESVPAGGDIYILSHIIHDWPEEQALAILRNCRNVMTPTSRLLLVEMVLSDDGTQHNGSADLSMLVLLGGAERSAREYDTLLAKAGLRMTRVIPTTTSASIIEACTQ